MASYKEKARAALVEKVKAAGLCDERGAAFVASSPSGFVLLAVNGDLLTISDIDMQHNIGRCLHRIPLKELSNLTIKEGFLSVLLGGTPLSFQWNGKKFAFSNLVITGGVKESVEVIKKESGK